MTTRDQYWAGVRRQCEEDTGRWVEIPGAPTWETINGYLLASRGLDKQRSTPSIFRDPSFEVQLWDKRIWARVTPQPAPVRSDLLQIALNYWREMFNNEILLDVDPEREFRESFRSLAIQQGYAKVTPADMESDGT